MRNVGSDDTGCCDRAWMMRALLMVLLGMQQGRDEWN